jgi:trk system potassium uptake protein
LFFPNLAQPPKIRYNTHVRVIIVGAGFTGTQLARHLIHEKYDVSLIESNEERARHASNRLDCLVLHDEGNSLESLEEAGIAQADALVCVTESDEINMIICGLAASRYPDVIKIARVRNDDYMKINSSELRGSGILGIDRFIHSDIEAAKAVLNAMSHGAQGNILQFSGTSYELGSVNITKGSVFDGLSLLDFHSFVRDEGLIALVERGQECFLPSGSTILQPGDLIHIVAREEDMDQVFSLAGRTETPIRRIGIVGGGRLGELIAEELLSNNVFFDTKKTKKGDLKSLIKSFVPKGKRSVTIIEEDYELCKNLSAKFQDALILNEDISDESFIAEERLGELDLIITVTDNQDLNIIAAIYLKSLGVRRAIAAVMSPGHKTIALQLGVDVAIPLKSVVVDSILSHLMGSGISDVHNLGDGSVSIVKIEIAEDSPAVEKNIKEFRLPQNGLLMLVNRGETSFIPQGDYVYKAGDKVVLIVKNGNETELEKYFGMAK